MTPSYEQMGLLWSSHPENKAQRYYDTGALERLKQIIVLRKLQIPVKDIAAIFRSETTAALTQAFVRKLDSLDSEIAALSELRRLVDDFLHQMLMSGIKKISAITLLYEETEKRLAPAAPGESDVSYERLEKVSREASGLRDVGLIRLPPMRALTSRLKTGALVGLDGDKMQRLFAEYGLLPTPGMRNCFFRKLEGDDWLMLMPLPPGFDNTTPYAEEAMSGGLFAVAGCYMEDLDDTFRLLREWARRSDQFAPDTQRQEMLEEILPWDIAERLNRYRQDVFIPVKLRNP